MSLKVGDRVFFITPRNERRFGRIEHMDAQDNITVKMGSQRYLVDKSHILSIAELEWDKYEF